MQESGLINGNSEQEDTEILIILRIVTTDVWEIGVVFNKEGQSRWNRNNNGCIEI